MGIFGSFFTGAISGIIGLGLASWLTVKIFGDGSSDSDDKEK